MPPCTGIDRPGHRQLFKSSGRIMYHNNGVSDMIEAFELLIITAVAGIIATVVALGALVLLSVRDKKSKA
jgi:hypothetical protein